MSRCNWLTGGRMCRAAVESPALEGRAKNEERKTG